MLILPRTDRRGLPKPVRLCIKNLGPANVLRRARWKGACWLRSEVEAQLAAKHPRLAADAGVEAERRADRVAAAVILLVEQVADVERGRNLGAHQVVPRHARV